MVLSGLDWSIVLVYFIVTLGIGIWASRLAGKSTTSFFLGGRNMPWWLLGVSMVATTFSTDTPNLVTDIVRQNGVSGNWVWWSFLLTGMLTVFIYARLWRRSGVVTDLEFYELRYSGKAAAFLRGFRAIYLGLFFNVMIMATVSLAAIKIGSVMLGLSPLETLIIANLVTVIYSALGGLLGVVWTDFFQFAIAMAGSIMAAHFALSLPEVGGLSGLLSNEIVVDKISLLPDFADKDALLMLLVLPLAVQWWSVWYPGAEPGGGGYIAQRMLSAKDEKHAVGATLFFNIAHYALRSWPWIIVALCSLIVFPDLQALKTAFPKIGDGVIGHDLAYPAMLTFLPAGLLGLVIASLIGAYMSTISTHLNWGSSYMVNDVYKRFINEQATDKQQVFAGRFSTVVLMVIASIIALFLSNALEAFQILLQIGAGTGLLFIMRWFWWRINPYSEFTAMIVSFLIAIYFQFVHKKLELPEVSGAVQLIIGVGITTFSWIMVTLFTQPSDQKTLDKFVRLIRPGGPGWKKVIARMDGYESGQKGWSVPSGILCMVLGSVAVYSVLFASGNLIYGKYMLGFGLLGVSGFATLLVFKVWSAMIRMDNSVKK